MEAIDTAPHKCLDAQTIDARNEVILRSCSSSPAVTGPIPRWSN